MLLNALTALGAEMLDSGGENKDINKSKNCYPSCSKNREISTPQIYLFTRH